MFDTCTLSISSAGVPIESGFGHHMVTGWSVEVKDGIVSCSGVRTYMGPPPGTTGNHKTFISDSGNSVLDLWEILRKEGVYR